MMRAMSKFIISAAVFVILACGSSCYRHDADNSLYFFSHHLPKKEKYERKAEYKKMIGKTKKSESGRAQAAEPGTFFPKDDI